jgi:hypothetical protein
MGNSDISIKRIMTNNQLKFTVFILNKYALATKQPITEVYKRFDELHILDDYLYLVVASAGSGRKV